MEIEVQRLDGRTSVEHVEISAVFNFGYAGRDRTTVLEHIAELAARGIPAPVVVPTLYPLPIDRVTMTSEIVVFGDQTYAEVEYALVLTAKGWVIGVGSDHSDAVIEQTSVSRAKRHCPDVLSRVMWPLDEVSGHLDDMVLTLTAYRADGESSEVQRGSCGMLLAPSSLIAILASRSSMSAPPLGTVILSGTIGGEPPVGVEVWHIALDDPVIGRTISAEYRVVVQPDELT